MPTVAVASGEIELRLAERASKARSIIDESISVEFWGVRYRVATRPELTLRRTDLLEVSIRETNLGDYALRLLVDRPLWEAVELMTTAYQGNHLAIFVDGSLILVATVEMAIPDGRLRINLYGRSKEEAIEMARRFSDTPLFESFGGTRTK